MSIRVTAELRGGFRRRVEAAVKSLETSELNARKRAASAANSKARSSFTHRRPIAPPRAGRDSTGGKLTDYVNWKPSSTDTMVTLDLAELNRRAPHWIIQEIGTGQRALQRNASEGNPNGRLARSQRAQAVRTVRSQRGRAIPMSLAWGTGPGGKWVPPGGQRNQQLYLRSTLRGAPQGPGTASRQMYITREIIGQHFVQKSGQEGNSVYRNEVLRAARTAFSSKARP